MNDPKSMIKNERQYRITKSQADKFREALLELQHSKDETLHPIQKKSHIEAISSQLDELDSQIAEYEALQSGDKKYLELYSFDEVSDALIKARIASGMSQKELAEKLQLKEQQIQRYEATDYRTASLERILEIIRALGIAVKKDLFLPNMEISSRKLFEQLINSGIDDELVVKRILPDLLVDRLGEGKGETEETKSLALRAAAMISKMFGWEIADLFGDKQLQLSTAVSGAARFKVTGRTDMKFLGFYTIYAYQIAMFTLKASKDLVIKPIPTDPSVVRQTILSEYGSISFPNALRYVWDSGVPVVPFTDSGAFHGACWRENGRNIIVLKQQTDSVSRWLFDLLHEFRHAGQNPEEEAFSIIEAEETSLERRESEEEEEASLFAGNVLLDDRAEELAQMCVNSAKRQIPKLKTAVKQIANKENVNVADLANYMAFRLSLEGENWWGTAANLQEQGKPWEIARNILFEKINLSYLTSSERELLMKALMS